MAVSNPRSKLPDVSKAGDVTEAKTLVRYVMVTGNRRDKTGQPLSRAILNTFIAQFGNQAVFRAEIGPGMSANPYLEDLGAADKTTLAAHAERIRDIQSRLSKLIA